MELPRIPDSGPSSPDAFIEGKAWCPRCDAETGFGIAGKVEFLGNPVRVAYTCAACGSPVHPEARDRDTAARLASEALRLRLSAAAMFVILLLLPLVLAAGVVLLVWRLL